MSNQQDIIIIGAGLIGLCTADALAERGAQVRVIEARSGPCQGTSFSNSGMIHPSQAMSWESGMHVPPEIARARRAAAVVTARLAERSKQILMEKMRLYGLPERRAGCLQLYTDMEAARAAQAEFNALEIETNILMNAVDTFDQVACHFPNDASGNSHVFGCALAADLAKRGVLFAYEATDLSIRRSEGTYFVSTSQGVFRSEHLVVAAGAGSPDVLARLGVRLQLNPVPGAAADFNLPDDKNDLPFCPVMDTQSRSALTVFEDRVRISGGWHVTEPSRLIEHWRDIAPGLMFRLGVPISTWSGYRPVSPVGRPYISETSCPNLWVNTGHGHMGWTLCAGSGEYLAELMLGGSRDRQFAFAG